MFLQCWKNKKNVIITHIRLILVLWRDLWWSSDFKEWTYFKSPWILDIRGIIWVVGVGITIIRLLSPNVGVGVRIRIIWFLILALRDIEHRAVLSRWEVLFIVPDDHLQQKKKKNRKNTRRKIKFLWTWNSMRILDLFEPTKTRERRLYFWCFYLLPALLPSGKWEWIDSSKSN